MPAAFRRIDRNRIKAIAVSQMLCPQTRVKAHNRRRADSRRPARDNWCHPRRDRHGLQLRSYSSSACPQCAMSSQCKPSTERRITLREHGSVQDAVQRRLDRTPDAMTIRKRTTEHVSGAFKISLAARVPTKDGINNLRGQFKNPCGGCLPSRQAVTLVASTREPTGWNRRLLMTNGGY